MKSFKEFQEAFGDKYQGHDVDNGPKKSEKKMKGKKTVALKGGTSVTTMPKTPEGPDKALGVKEEAPPGKKYERMVKHIKKSYAKDGKLTKDEKSIAYATAWKNKNKKK